MKNKGVRVWHSNEDPLQWCQVEQDDSMTEPIPDLGVPHSASYIGKLINGKPTGYGILNVMYNYGGTVITYWGKWKDGKYHGKGTLEKVFSSHSYKYRGHFRNGLPHGRGKESSLSGDFKGIWENGVPVKTVEIV